ncbi:MAG TPA: hypothetical protein VL137_14735 [Polyangiaceae bacterium]|nr:hypothetical protein [Polyangiaceae bacterium]
MAFRQQPVPGSPDFMGVRASRADRDLFVPKSVEVDLASAARAPSARVQVGFSHGSEGMPQVSDGQ